MTSMKVAVREPEAKLIDLMVIESELSEENSGLSGLVSRAVGSVRPGEHDARRNDAVKAPKKKWIAHYMQDGHDPKDYNAYVVTRDALLEDSEDELENRVEQGEAPSNDVPNVAAAVGADDGRRLEQPMMVVEPPTPTPIPSLPIVVEPRGQMPGVVAVDGLPMIAVELAPPPPPLPPPRRHFQPAPQNLAFVSDQAVAFIRQPVPATSASGGSADAPPKKRSNFLIFPSNGGSGNGGLGATNGASGSGGTREVHNRLEKFRRAQLKECYEELRRQLPNISDSRKVSNLIVLRNAHKYIQCLKRKEREHEHEMERLARDKISLTQKFNVLKDEFSQRSAVDKVDWDALEEMAVAAVKRRRGLPTDDLNQPGPSGAHVGAQAQPPQKLANSYDPWRQEQNGAKVDDDQDSNTSTASECPEMEDCEFGSSGASTSSGFSELRSVSSSSSRYHQSPGSSSSSSRSHSCSASNDNGSVGKLSPKRHSPQTTLTRYPGAVKRVSPMVMYPPTPPNSNGNYSIPMSPHHSPKGYSVHGMQGPVSPPGVMYSGARAQMELDSRHHHQTVSWAPEPPNMHGLVERNLHIVSPEPLREEPRDYSAAYPREVFPDDMESKSDALDLSMPTAKAKREQLMSMPVPPPVPSLPPSPMPPALAPVENADFYDGHSNGFNGFEPGPYAHHFYGKNFPLAPNFPTMGEPSMTPYLLSPGHHHHMSAQAAARAQAQADAQFEALKRSTTSSLPPLGPGMPFPPPSLPEGVTLNVPMGVEITRHALHAPHLGVPSHLHSMGNGVGHPRSLIHVGPDRLTPVSGAPVMMPTCSPHVAGIPNGIHATKGPAVALQLEQPSRMLIKGSRNSAIMSAPGPSSVQLQRVNHVPSSQHGKMTAGPAFKHQHLSIGHPHPAMSAPLGVPSPAGPLYSPVGQHMFKPAMMGVPVHSRRPRCGSRGSSQDVKPAMGSS